MKIINVQLSRFKLLAILVFIAACIFILFSIVSLAKNILTKNFIEITNDNYTKILMDSYDNIENYLGKNITITGYVFRLEDFGNNEFVIARDMLVDESHSQIVGFLCQYNQISHFETNSWIKITGTIEKGHYFGEIPIIQVKTIKKVTTPNEIFVSPPQVKEG